jgi:hypothetical protein
MLTLGGQPAEVLAYHDEGTVAVKTPTPVDHDDAVLLSFDEGEGTAVYRVPADALVETPED